MGREKRNEKRVEHYTTMTRHTIETDAWRALSHPAAQLLSCIKFEWKGAKFNNNGKIRLSVRQAADMMNCGPNTASRAFHDLQAKGFIVVTERASLGVTGQGASPAFELTEHPLPGNHEGRKLFYRWKSGDDFAVIKAAVHNQNGRRKKQNPVTEAVTPRNRSGDGTRCFEGADVTEAVTSLSYQVCTPSEPHPRTFAVVRGSVLVRSGVRVARGSAA